MLFDSPEEVADASELDVADADADVVGGVDGVVDEQPDMQIVDIAITNNNTSPFTALPFSFTIFPFHMMGTFARLFFHWHPFLRILFVGAKSENRQSASISNAHQQSRTRHRPGAANTRPKTKEEILLIPGKKRPFRKDRKPRMHD